MSEESRPSPLGEEIAAGLSKFCDALEAGEPIENHFSVRTLRLELDPRIYQAAEVKAVRRNLNASRGLLARFLGVSVQAVRAWERGTRPVPRIACRFLDEIVANPDVWKRRIRESVATGRAESSEP